MHESTIIQRALLTVYDKTRLVELAERLHLRGIELISTGNTALHLKQHGLPVISVNEYTGFPEIMDGRVKTLHPKIHGGILGRRDIDGDVMLAHHIPDIDLVVVNLYPFQQVIQDPASTLEDIIENIDVGGPTLLRAAAKNYEWCTVLVDPNDYHAFIQELESNQGAVKHPTRFRFAAKAFAQSARYDSVIANFFAQKSENQLANGFGATLSLQYQLKERLRYGENPQQHGAFYQEDNPPKDSIVNATQLQGKALSFNNILDADCALECVKHFEHPACVIVKHANPCGVAIADTPLMSYDKAYQCDPTSAFGGIIAFNRIVDEALLQHVFDKQFIEILIAPGFTPEALNIAQQKNLCRLLHYEANGVSEHFSQSLPLDIKSVNGGILVQTVDPAFNSSEFRVVTKHSPSQEDMRNLLLGWQVVKYVKSNAIVFTHHLQTIGIGAGQMSRIFSIEIASLKANSAHLSLQGACLASDAFFPFKDSIEMAHRLGITAIIQPGGSKRDQEVIDCANELGIAMIFTGMRCFRH